jgi:transcriptional regulator with XRE-family HTH domain
VEHLDPRTFGERLHHLRTARQLSLRDLAKLAHHSKTVVWEWESGLKQPTPDTAAKLDEILEGGGRLAAAASRLTTPTGVDLDRITHAAARPRTVDRAAVDALAGVLANMRRLEDSIGARPLIAVTTGPLKVVENLADEAHGPIRAAVIDLAGQWAQFAGWLRAATERPDIDAARAQRRRAPTVGGSRVKR